MAADLWNLVFSGPNWFFRGQAASTIGDFAYYARIYKFIQEEVRAIGPAIMGNFMTVIGAFALSLMTIWVLVQGFRIVTGQSRDDIMGFVMSAARNTLIISAATTMSLGSTQLSTIVVDYLDKAAVHVITGEEENSSDLIERNLVLTQLAMSSIDSVDVSEEGRIGLSSEKTRAVLMAGFGAAGPAVTGAGLSLMYEIALALFIGFGPLFILFLLFEQTKPMFWRWLYYGVGTLFSMAVLALMSTLAMKVSIIVATSFWLTAAVGSGIGQNMTEGMSSLAMQQGGIGLLLTMMLISVPPIASSFFQGALGSFQTNSAFGQGAAAAGRARMPGSTAPSGYMGAQQAPAPVNPSRVTGELQGPKNSFPSPQLLGIDRQAGASQTVPSGQRGVASVDDKQRVSKE